MQKDLEQKLEFVKKEMAKFFSCDQSLIKFSDAIYFNSKAKIKVIFKYQDKKLYANDKIISSTYQFDFDIELKQDTIFYLGKIYSYDELYDFFTALSVEIKKTE